MDVRLRGAGGASANRRRVHRTGRRPPQSSLSLDDEKIEWDWFELHHHEGRRARHGAAMMAPDYAHWHGMYEVAQDFYEKVIPEAREIIARAASRGQVAQAKAAGAVLDEILARPEHAWYLEEKAKEKAKERASPPAGLDHRR